MKDSIIQIGPDADQSQFFIHGKFDDSAFMRSPADWLAKSATGEPYLPVKMRKGSEMPRCAIVLNNGLATVYEYDGVTVIKEYKDFDELVMAGWVVD